MQRSAVIIALGIHLAAIGLAIASSAVALGSNAPDLTTFDRIFGFGFGVACLALALNVTLTLDRLCVVAAAVLFPFAVIAGGFAAPALLATVLGWFVVSIVHKEHRLVVPTGVIRFKQPIRYVGRLAGAASVAAVVGIVGATIHSIPDQQQMQQRIPVKAVKGIEI